MGTKVCHEAAHLFDTAKALVWVLGINIEHSLAFVQLANRKQELAR